VSGFILVTLVYFQLLQAVKDSDFLNAEAGETGQSGVIAASRNRLTTVRKASGQERWIGVNSGSKGASESAEEVYFQQVLLSLDLHQSIPTASKSLQDSPELLKDVQFVDAALRQHFGLAGDQLLFDPDLCHQPPTSASCFSISYQNAQTPSTYFPSTRKTILTYAFSAEAKDAANEWMSKLQDPSVLSSLNSYISTRTSSSVELRLPSSKRSAPAQSDNSQTSILNNSAASLPRTQSGLGLSLPLSPRTGNLHYREGGVRDLSGPRWLIHAVKTFVLRFWTLAKVRRLSGIVYLKAKSSCFLFAESRLCGYCCYAVWLCLDARNIR